MNKIAEYLNTHLVGEVVTNSATRKAYATDGSVLALTPEMVAFPRRTNDIRKIARFAWQLAEKGHVLGVTARGNGSDTTGAAIGSGIVINFPSHMNTIFEYDAKQKLVRLQPGVTVGTLQNALSLYGTGIPRLRSALSQATLGGVVANCRHALEYIDQVEVVLANGDILQTQALSKRELAKKKGEQSFEGEIYRKLDALIEDNEALISSLASEDEPLDHFGFAAIANVKQKNGSFDLTPLLAGSQGTLAVVSEMILQAEYVDQAPAIVVAAFKEEAHARDAIDALEKLELRDLTYLNGAYVETASVFGKTYETFETMKNDSGAVGAVLIMTISDLSTHAKHKKLKKIQKVLKPFDAEIIVDEDETVSDLDAMFSLAEWQLNPDDKDTATPPLLEGFSVPLERFEEFNSALVALAKKHHVELPLYGRPLEEVWYARPQLKLGTVGDKQKVFKLSNDLIQLVQSHAGVPFAASGEGRLHAHQTKALLDEQMVELYRQVKEVFDPLGILNPGVKQPGDVRDTVKLLRSEYVAPAATDFVARF